jgi:hypothetical protein
MRPSLANVMRDRPALYNDGCHSEGRNTTVQDCHWGDPATAPLKVALFGDSHAAQWFPALARLVASRHWYLETYTKSACPPVPRPDGETAACTAWRQNVIAHLQEHRVDVVVISGAWAEATDRGTLAGADDAWDAGIAATVTALAVGKQQVVYLADTPTWASNPNICLSRHLKDTAACAQSPASTLAPDDVLAADKKAAVSAGGRYLSLDGYFCSATTCPLVIGNALVYREGSHITTVYSRLMSDAFGDGLEAALESEKKSAQK